MEQNHSATWKLISVVLAVALIMVLCAWFITARNSKGTTMTLPGDADIETLAGDKIGAAESDPLSLWTDDASLKTELTAYMETITDENSADFIPVRDRIAVFDMDGTLCCETDPGYFDHKLLYHRVMEDIDYKDKASTEEKATAAKIRTYFETGEYPEDLSIAHGKAVASAFRGMTVDEFDAYVKAYRDEPMESYSGMTNGEAFYKPMLQVVDYLNANDFTVYIVSGTDRLITRGLAEGVVDIPLRQMIGSDEKLVASGQGDEDGLDYTFSSGDDLITSGDFLIKNLKTNKVTVIEQEIGQQPVLAFGNSSGDFAMANYTINSNKYKTGAYMLCCDDLERERGNVKKAEKMRVNCEENGYTAVSMKNDWTTIYGEGVTYTGHSEPVENKAASAAPGQETPGVDYSDESNWAYYAVGDNKDADLFLICPTVDMKDEFNMSMDDEETKESFLGALNMERGIYEDSTRMFAPYYRQAAMKVYGLDRAEWEPYMEVAYSDVSAAFSEYLEKENDGRPIILAGFSQGADMCYRLLKEYFGDEKLYEQLVAVYAIGWPCTQEMTTQYPQIRPALYDDDTGVVISFDCEAPDVTDTFINPAGQTAYAINPLNWKTNSTPADKSLNLGACFTDYSGEIRSETASFCGCYLDKNRSVIKVTDINGDDYAPVVPGLPEGAYHVYDYQFFFRNLQQNVADRIKAYLILEMDQAA